MQPFPEQLHVLDRRWPALARSLGEAPEAEVVPRTDGPCPTLSVDGLQLTSAFDREAEARLQAGRVPQGAARATVYGLALGDLPRVLLARRELRHLRVVVLARSAALASLRAFDHGDWIGDPRVELVLGRDAQELETPYAVAPTCLRLAELEACAARDAVLFDLGAAFQRRHLDELAAEHALRLEENRDLLERDGDVSELFDSRPGATALVAGGGPTLAERWDWIRERRSQIFLVAPTTVLLPLQRAGIAPDVALAVDSWELLARHFDDLDPERLRNVPLAYAPVVCREALERWPGPRLVACTPSPLELALASRGGRGVLHCSGSVLHAAVDLAVRAGAHRVLLAGCDFAHPDRKSHVDGFALNKTRGADAARHALPDGHGEPVATDPNLIGYLRDLESYVAAHSEVVFENLGLRGAAIAGVPHLAETAA